MITIDPMPSETSTTSHSEVPLPVLPFEGCSRQVLPWSSDAIVAQCSLASPAGRRYPAISSRPDESCVAWPLPGVMTASPGRATSAVMLRAALHVTPRSVEVVCHSESSPDRRPLCVVDSAASRCTSLVDASYTAVGSQNSQPACATRGHSVAPRMEAGSMMVWIFDQVRPRSVLRLSTTVCVPSKSPQPPRRPSAYASRTVAFGDWNERRPGMRKAFEPPSPGAKTVKVGGSAAQREVSVIISAHRGRWELGAQSVGSAINTTAQRCEL